MNEKERKEAIKWINQVSNEEDFKEFVFQDSDKLLKEFYMLFGYPFPDHANIDTTGFFEPILKSIYSEKLYFVCSHFEGTNLDDIEKLVKFMRNLEKSLIKNGFCAIEIHIGFMDGNAEILVLEIYYHKSSEKRKC